MNTVVVFDEGGGTCVAVNNVSHEQMHGNSANGWCHCQCQIDPLYSCRMSHYTVTEHMYGCFVCCRYISTFTARYVSAYRTPVHMNCLSMAVLTTFNWSLFLDKRPHFDTSRPKGIIRYR